jgi:hypothetical protein
MIAKTARVHLIPKFLVKSLKNHISLQKNSKNLYVYRIFNSIKLHSYHACNFSYMPNDGHKNCLFTIPRDVAGIGLESPTFRRQITETQALFAGRRSLNALKLLFLNKIFICMQSFLSKYLPQS